MEAVKRLEAEGRIIALVDDRGKMVSVTEDEIKQVTELIHSEGRISISRLTILCGNIIDMKN